MSARLEVDRRDFLRITGLAGGGLILGFYLPAASPGAHAAVMPADSFSPNAFIRVGDNDRVTILVGQSEMGQGVLSAFAMVIAEELEVDLSAIDVQNGPAAKEFFNPAFGALGMQLTGGSASVRGFYPLLRKAGAAGRAVLIQAAANSWNVPASECRAEHGNVIHIGSAKHARYGTLVAAAAKLTPPADAPLKDPKDFRLLGKPAKRLDTAPKVNGQAIFGIDVKLPGLLTARVARCPVFGGKVAKFDATKAKAVAGVRHVVQIDAGVAVVADNYWAAKKGRDALDITWDEGPNAGMTSVDINDILAGAVAQPGAVARNEGNVDAEWVKVAKKVEAVYEVPYLAHATMEPMNFTADVRKDGCDIWGGTQSQTWALGAAARITGLPADKINVHTTLLGGGFGRRAEVDFVIEAIQASKAVGAPVKVVWTREDDIQHDFYRPGSYNKFTGGLDASGKLVAWLHRTSSASIFAAHGFGNPPVDDAAVEGAKDLPYQIPNLRVEWGHVEPGIPVGFWRSVGHSHTAFTTECFLDEMAHAAGKDPYAFRMSMLPEGRHKRVLELAATKAGWGKPLIEGHFRGIAQQESFNSFVAQVAEVSVADDGTVRVHKIVCAIDCGPTVNPDTIEAQMQSCIAYGLTAAFKGEITFDRGRVVQRNFHDYQILRMNEMPQVEVHIVQSTDAMGGVGEPGTPPVAPAVCNAIFAATGKRIRRLPINTTELRRG